MEKTIYKIGLLLPLAGICAAALYHFLPILHHPCILHTFTGIYCPGCGGTRAVRALLHGHFLKSIYFHPFVPYFVVLYLSFMITNTLQILTKDKLKIGMKYHNIYLYLGLAIILINWSIRNLLLPLP